MTGPGVHALQVPADAVYTIVLTAEAVVMPSFAVHTIVREPPAVVVPLKLTLCSTVW